MCSSFEYGESGCIRSKSLITEKAEQKLTISYLMKIINFKDIYDRVWFINSKARTPLSKGVENAIL
jgi:hypothetical protein